MSEICVEIGKRIRAFRKRRKMTQTELSGIICKSKSTLSKYEKGEISVDIETLYVLSDALGVHVEQLLYCRPVDQLLGDSSSLPTFFVGRSHFYGYIFDGRDNRILRCFFDVLSETDRNQYKIMLYMNFLDYEHYQNCETTYYGYIEHYGALTDINLTNQDSPIEKASCKILAPYLDADTKWGLWTGISSRPVMPVAGKMLISKKRLLENEELITRLKISKEDVRLIKQYNFLPVT